MKKRKKRSGGSRNRQKGHNLERELAKFFRDMGFKFCRTSRQASRLIDDCGIDLVNIPVIIQAKAGYDRNRPKYDNIYKNIKEKLKIHFPEEHELHRQPIILVNKINGRGKDMYTWTFAHEDIVNMIESNQLKFE